MSSPVNRTALREQENRSAPASQQVSASAVTGPTPYSRAGEYLRVGQVRGGLPQLVAQRAQPGFGGGEHVQRGGDLRLPGRRQVRGRGGPQTGQALLGAQRTLA